MSIKQLRTAIAPCCGLGANRAEVDAALNNVAVSHGLRKALLLEVFHIVDSAIIDISHLRKPLSMSSATVQNLVAAREAMARNIQEIQTNDSSQEADKNALRTSTSSIAVPVEEEIKLHSRSALEREVEMTETLIEYDAKPFPDGTTPEEAYIAALKFVMNQQGSSVREDYEDLMESQDAK